MRQLQNEIFDKDIGGKVAMGADNLERAFFARQFHGEDTKVRDRDGRDTGQVLKDGNWYSTYRNSDGTYKQYASGEVAAAHRKYNGDESKIQTLIKYETGKVPNDQDFYGVDKNNNTIYDPSEINANIDREAMPMGSFLGNLPAVLSEAGLSPTSAAGASIGSFFGTQTQRKELKHTKLSGDERGWKQDEPAFVQDWAENIGTYAASTSKTSPINRLASIHRGLTAKQAAGETLTVSEQRSMRDLTSIATGLDQRLRGGYGIGTVTEEGVPIPGAAGTGAPGRVNDAIRAFVEQVIPNPTGAGYPRSGGGTPPSGIPPGPKSQWTSWGRIRTGRADYA